MYVNSTVRRYLKSNWWVSGDILWLTASSIGNNENRILKKEERKYPEDLNKSIHRVYNQFKHTGKINVKMLRL